MEKIELEKNPKYVFVVLHYWTLDDTVECVESILKNITYDNYHIVVVDNGSPNKTGKTLFEKYNAHPKITIILNEKNLGFARGNNVGFEFAKRKLNADFIALINNDTIIQQSDFIQKTIEEFRRSNFHILGPDIISLKDGGHQNPSPVTLQNYEELKGIIKHYKIKLFLNYLFVDKFLEELKKKIIKKPFVKQTIVKSGTWEKRAEGVKLHGSAIIFSRLYIDRYDGLNPDTFMHNEEAILYFIVKRDGLKTVYSPEIKIFHKEDSSTNSITKSGLKKRRFYYSNYVKSAKVLLKLMEGEE